MKQFKNILVATDTQLDGHPIVDEAVKLAKHDEAKIKIVDVVSEFSWVVRRSLKNHEQILEMMEREKQTQLDKLAAPIRDQGIHVDTKVLRGKSSVELIREVLRHRHDLVLRVAKGKDSRRKGTFGTTGTRLLRECPCAVWLVAPAATPQYKHVLGCVDTSTDDTLDAELNDKIYQSAALVSDYHGAQLSIVQAWTSFAEELLQGRMGAEDFAEMMKKNHDYNETQFDEFLKLHGSSVREQDVHLIKGDASAVIPAFVDKNGVDLVVMGTVARSGAVGMIVGNTAERILNTIECSVLALKPDSFVSPITLGDYIAPTREERKP